MLGLLQLTNVGLYKLLQSLPDFLEAQYIVNG